MSKIILSGYIIVPEPDLEAVQEKLPEHILKTREEEGCLVFNVDQDPADPCRFQVYEEFKNNAAFEFHQARVGASEWGEVTRNVKRHYMIEGNDS